MEDLKDNRLSIPHELFDEDDAKKALDDSREIINNIKGLVEEKRDKKR